ncbi:12306_t:CDS:2, partial [Funneliformis geosporum]
PYNLETFSQFKGNLTIEQYGFLHINRQNKLKNKKHLHITTPIIEDNNINSSEFDNLSDNNLLVSDDNNGENESNNLALNASSKSYTKEQE